MDPALARRHARAALGLIVGCVTASAIVCLAAPPGPAVAGPRETLVMPGPLAKAHADAESDCAKCHQAFASSAQRGLCLDCHEDVAADLGTHTGFHGRSGAASRGDCRSCHAEHRGRDADIVGLDRASFTHGATDFALREAHTSVPCQGCHVAGKKWRAAPSKCQDCHAKDDPHSGRMGSDCASCHGEARWSDARFDHDRTRFKLTGGHEKVQCATCHPGERYKGTPSDCGSCHALNDVHHGRMGADCASCHSTTSWKTSRFDHGKTRFPLSGRHAVVSCEACHAGASFTSTLATDCLSCHRSDDVHEGRNGARCQECHSSAAWKPASFDHERATHFPLRGAHQRTACESCHTGPVHQQKLETRCIACHEKADVHHAQQGTDCARCHNELGWKKNVAFDHELSRFPLLGMHAVVACEECHATRAFRGTERTCIACHAKVDRHEARLGTTCETCHNPNGWPLWKFDHATQTSFALHGAHEAVACETCHAQPMKTAQALPKTCIGCHAADDRHGGAFGSRCQECHGERSWQDLTISR